MSFQKKCGLERGEGVSGLDANQGKAGYEESTFEQTIRRNIQQIRTNIQFNDENLDNCCGNMLSRRIVESLHDRLKQTYEIVVQTEQIFRDWTLELAGDPFEKNKRKFIFEKLAAHFQGEVCRLKDVSERVQKFANRIAETGVSGSSGDGEVAGGEGREHYNNYNNMKDIYIGSGNEQCNGDLDNDVYDTYENSVGSDLIRVEGVRGQDIKPYVPKDRSPLTWTPIPSQANSLIQTSEMMDASEHESLIRHNVAEERLSGIKRIQHQVSQANQIFRDLASLVVQQDAQLETIDGNVKQGQSLAKGAASELRKAYLLQRTARQRKCLLLIIAAILLTIVFYIFHLSPHATPHLTTALTELKKPAAPVLQSQAAGVIQNPG